VIDQQRSTGTAAETGHLPGRFAPISDGDTAWVCDTGRTAEQRGTLVFLHSAVGNLGTFKHQLGWFALNGFRAVAYDRRGHGRTPSGRHGLKFATPEGDLAVLLEGLGVKGPVHLVGAAAGGRLAVDFALARPDLVASLTLVCSMAGIAADIYPEGTSALLPPEFLALPPYLRELGPVYRGDNPAGTMAWRALVEDTVPKDIVSDPAKWVAKPTSTAANSHQPASPRPRGLRGLEWLLEPGGATERGIPLHLITGDADPYTTPSAYARLSRALTGAVFDVVTGSGHSPYWERPDDFNAMVLQNISTAISQGAPA
jgi:pimeloyl-ACP methyl ester carboxylesterase